VVELLIQALKDKDSSIREGSAQALGNIKDERVVEPLIQALKDETSNVRKAAAISLGKIKDTRGMESLIDALEDEWIQQDVAIILQEGYNRPMESLIHALEDEWIQQDMARALAHIKDEYETELLVQILRDRERNIQKIAAQALRSLRTVDTVAYPRTFVYGQVQDVEYENRKVRRLADETLAKMRVTNP
ncbi:MAG: HEAT repeat domain-containing protein, partial [Theionarchaea archaeon]|nr:HEAT repeat domain-containing protein [Theionarchaea archaeon]